MSIQMKQSPERRRKKLNYLSSAASGLQPKERSREEEKTVHLCVILLILYGV